MCINDYEARRGAGAQSITVKPTGCGFDLLGWFLALVSRQSAALSFATQHAMPSEFGRK